MKRAPVQSKSPKSKQKRVKPLWERWLAPLRVLLFVALTFGVSSVGRAAEKVKRGIKSKKNSWKATYAALLTAKAWGYFRPAWVQADVRERTLPIEGVDKLMDDPDNRVERDFRVRSGLRSRVAFWIDIYARFTSEYRVIHDKDNPEIIYGYLDFRPLYRSMPKGMAHARAHQIEERVIRELKERIAEAMEVNKVREPHLSEQEKKDLRALLADHGIKTASDALRPIKRVRAQTGQKDHFLKGIYRSQKLMANVEQIFREKNLPVGLARLPFVESAYNRGAVSKVGAIGMWQFLPETARLFAPRSTWNELSDPLKQSKSAAKMFSILHGKFDDWGLAVTAYNSGAVRVKRIADTNSASDVEKMLRIPLKKGNLGFAGNNFYCEFLAALYVENYKDRLFTQQEAQLARIDMPRRIQSLFGGNSQPEPVKVATAAPTPTAAPPVQDKAPVKKVVVLKKQPRPKLRLAASRHGHHGKKKVRGSHKHRAHRPHRTAQHRTHRPTRRG